MKKTILIFVILCLVTPVRAQLTNFLQVVADSGNTNILGNPPSNRPVWSVILRHATLTDSLIQSLQDYGQSIDNYASVSTAKTDAKAKSGLLIVPRKSSYDDSTVTVVSSDSIVVFDFRNGRLSIFGKFSTPATEDWDDVIAWWADGSNDADKDTLNSREEVFKFDTALAETLWATTRLPSFWSAIDSVEIRVSAASTAGDSATFRWGYVGIGNNENTAGAAYTVLADTVDLGTSSGFLISMKITSGFTGLSAGDRVIMFLTRDGTISNDEAGDVRVHETIIYRR